MVSAPDGWASEQALTGKARVIDGDTVKIRGTKVRLSGIDAPEIRQLCQRQNGESWRCGQFASDALAKKIGTRTVTCLRENTDRYGRMIAVCHTDTDLNDYMVREGLAVAYRYYSMKYAASEEKAKAKQAGIWSGRFVMPWDWRRGSRLASPVAQAGQAAAAAAEQDCLIKGNITPGGEKIYHTSEDRYYSRVRISPESGERFFCSEQEALAAGWRRSLR